MTDFSKIEKEFEEKSSRGFFGGHFRDEDVDWQMVLDFFRSHWHNREVELKSRIKEELMNHKFNVFGAETALMDGGQKLSTVKKQRVIDADEIIKFFEDFFSR